MACSIPVRLCCLAVLSLLVLLMAACGSSPIPPVRADGGSDDGGDTSGDGGTGDAGDPCPGAAPLCAPSCGGDVFYGPAQCAEGGWACEEGVLMTDCPSGTCWGLPMPGEVCEDGWQCRPWQTGALEDCPAEGQLCADCRGFEAPYTEDGCSCACEDGLVRCSPVDERCTPTARSTLPGVELHITETECVYTLEEVATGIVLDYEAVVGHFAPSQGTAGPTDVGSCQSLEASGLIVYAEIVGGTERYCLCDVGNCPGQAHPTRFAPGTYPGTFEWTGRNWFGPSDFGNPMGDPFPPGTYTFRVVARGTYGDGDAAQPYEVEATLPIVLVAGP